MPDDRQPIHALVVDYGEVLCEAPDPAEFADMAGVAGVELETFADAYWRLRPTYDRGEVDGPEYWRLLGEKVGAHIDGTRVSELVARDVGLWARVDDRMLGWANAVADSGVPVGLLSNMVREIGIHLRDTLRLFESFTSVTYSYEVHAVKPDHRIYAHALADLGAEPHETLFVDDRIANVEAARALGMHAHHFHDRERLVAEIDERYALVPTGS